jgi:spermidine synthase
MADLAPAPSRFLTRVSVGLVVFAANAAILVLQLAAGRLLAPFVGVTLATWTCLIGVFLAGIGLGNAAGGRLAARQPGPGVLRRLLLVGAVCAAWVAVLPLLLGEGEWLRPVPLSVRIVLLTFAVGLPASFVLSLITPVAIQLLLTEVGRTGRVAGRVYALGTLGSLAGVFLTGFVLTGQFTLNEIVLGTAAALAVVALAPVGAPVSRDAEPSIRATLRVTANPIPIPRACAIAAVGGFASMALEIGASRLMAPLVGVSLYSWTGVIGVILAGMALGNAFGGWLADRWPRPAGLAACLLLAALTTLEILLFLAVSTHSLLLDRMPLVPRIVVWAGSLFLLPALLLGTVTPQAIRLAVPDRERAGAVAGRVYAWSTGGAVAGTFLTGTILVPLLGVYRLVLVLSLVLALLAAAVGQLWRKPGALLGAGLVLGAAAVGIADSGLVQPFTLETAYFAIQVRDTDDDGHTLQLPDGRHYRKLALDRLVHSMVVPGDPTYLGYEHEQVHAEVLRGITTRLPAPRVLVIGGGGYTFPRWIDAELPAASVEVVEIDPGVTEVAHRELGLPRDTRIVSHHLDGRQFLADRSAGAAYDLIVMDAVNDLSVPFHLLTRECAELVRRRLSPDGVYLVSVIDDFDDGQMLRASVRTLRRSFPQVTLLAACPPAWDGGKTHGVFVIYASERPFDGAGMAKTVALPPASLEAYVATGPQTVLTDQFAPVDQLIANVVRRHN